VAAVVALMAVGVAQALRPLEVTPASGPGSLPDQIFPTREHILTLEQAPIGRVSMVYEQSWADGSPPAWIAVGADSDEYRSVATAADLGSPPPEAEVQLSPSGTQLAVSESGDTAASFDVRIIDASAGTSTVVIDGEQAPMGGRVDTLAWSPDGDSLFVAAYVVVKRLSDSARRSEPRHFVISGLSSPGQPPRLETNEIPLVGQMVGWSRGEPVILLAKKPTGLIEPEIRRHDLVAVDSLQVLGRVQRPPTMVSGKALSPDGTRLAALSDPTAGSSGDGRSWRLQVFDTQTGGLVTEYTGVPEDLSAMVGWRDARTPVLYTAEPGTRRSAPPRVQVAAYPPSAGEAVRIVDLAPSSDRGEGVWNAVVAADVLASGNVRVAEPPHQPWNDPRTLGPAISDTTGGLAGNAAAQGLVLVLLVVGGLVLVTRRTNRRRRLEARSQSGS
jgi:hypothetical protein